MATRSSWQTASCSPSSSQACRNSPTLSYGKISYLNRASGYGFLTPIDQANVRAPASGAAHGTSLEAKAAGESVSDSAPSCNVYFKLPSSDLGIRAVTCHTGFMNLQLGDTLEFIINKYNPEKPRAIFARLIACSSRTVDDIASYLTLLLSHCRQDDGTVAVLKEVTKAPQGLLLILKHPNPDQTLVFLMLKLSMAICDRCKEASLYGSKIKEFFRLFICTPFIMAENAGLCKLLMRLQNENAKTPSTSSMGFLEKLLHRAKHSELELKIESEWGKPLYTLIHSIKNLLLRILQELPDELPCLVHLIHILDKMQGKEFQEQPDGKDKFISNQEVSFAMQVISTIAQAKGIGMDDPSVSWSKLSLLPLTSEVTNALDQIAPSVNLPVAKLKGSYGSTDEYIDTYFRLLREDSFASLKKGISDFVSGRLDHRDMTVWFGVCPIGVHFHNSLPSMAIGLQLKDGQANNSNSKPPLAGSLLCICDSGGSFRNPVWALAARCEKLKNTTILFVEVLEGTPAASSEHLKASSPWARILQASGMVVAESPAYYRAYAPVLKALQNLDPETMPFQYELVHAKSPRKAPDYLNNSTILDWSCLNAPDSSNTYGEFKAGIHELAQPTLRGFQTTLDKTQVDAINHVLQNQLAIIQGPPGTGKTFLSVRIVQLLLSASTRPQKPVLIITYKNKALDQFLESCLKFCNPGKLVRVGGSSKGDKLASCNLQHLLRTADRLPSDWIANSEKLAQLQTKLRTALSNLYRCQSFNVETITSQPSLQGLLHKLLLTRDKKTAASLESKDISGLEPKDLSRLLKQWIPHKAVFNAVQACFSSLQPATTPRRGSFANPVSGKNTNVYDEENPKDFAQENEKRNDSENLWQDIRGINYPGFKGTKETNWQNNNFLDLRDIDLHKDGLFQSFSLSNFDSDGYTWLLEADPWELSHEHRCILVLDIMRQNLEACIKELSKLKEEYNQVCTDNAEIDRQRRVAILQEAEIIGMTTTGAAINQDILAAISPSIILVEEAAEILEPQLMAVLSPNVKHLILIGDHKQLRPSVESYELETRHNLGISMLERLAENKLPFQTLGLQSRMREEFLQMIIPIYPNLRSNTEVVYGTRNQPAKCMASTMYFWNHSFQETVGRSPTNEGEAHMVVALSKWLLSEGHKPDEITVICAYNGQHTLPTAGKVASHILTKHKKNEEAACLNCTLGCSLENAKSCSSVGHSCKGMTSPSEHKPLKTLDIFAVNFPVYHSAPTSPHDVPLYLSDNGSPHPPSPCWEMLGKVEAKKQRLLSLPLTYQGSFLQKMRTLSLIRPLPANAAHNSANLMTLHRIACARYKQCMPVCWCKVSQVRRMLDEIRGEEEAAIGVQTIDMFQGSENRIIVASLVRSNPEGKIGHLFAQNRLCVTVTRARSGLYLCGNAETLSRRSPHWKTLIDECFIAQNCLGEKIFLTCPRHPKDPLIPLHNKDAQEFSPNVCNKPCKALLTCGHHCTNTCHHGTHALCKVKVTYIFEKCKHSTIKICSESDASLKCYEELWITLEVCGHTKKCKCWEKVEKVSSALACRLPCGKTLVCKHPCTLLCSEKCDSKPCPKCAEIERIKAQKEKESLMRQRIEKMSDIDCQIEKLKTEHEVGPFFKELLPKGETAAEYRMVQDRTEKFIQPTHKTLPVVTKIEKVTNLKLELEFLKAQHDLTEVLAPPQLLFHGTDDEGVKGITSNGFRLPSASKSNMFGTGCYFATDSSKSAQQLYTKGSNKLLLCEVLLGRPWSLTSARPDLYYGLVRSKMYDSVFSMRNSKESGGTEYDEYVVYQPSQAIPRYVVHYKNLDCSASELQSLFQNKAGLEFERRVLEASTSSYNGVTGDEFHFRFAEAQFLRMSNNRGQKVEKVEYTWNKELHERYEKKKQQFEAEKKPTDEQLVFHGTTKESIDKIIREGFKVGGEGVPIKTGMLYGSGVYTAANPETSIPYSRGSGMILLSVALCGELGRDYNKGGSQDTFVVKKGDQLLPRYIVHFHSC